MANHSAHSATTPVAGPSGGHADSGAHGGHGHDVSKEVRKYMLVFGALLLGTLITVWASYIDFGTPSANIVVALIIATIKAALVGAFFMHLIDERKLVYGVLGATIFFFIGLMYVTLWSMEPTSFIHLKR
ncbi:MAG TPA: cytochrome C oxidase subunit IV family protein [Verrucomicrobiae bacterium]|nr:cytochrome C oxidase subunit IV family protein [Verrucomicrobiae bacterium]